MRISKNIFVALASTFLLASCASVKIIKVTGAPEPEGFPFYLPRAYVQVYEPFVINSKVYLVAGSLSPDGNYLLIDNATDQDRLGGLLSYDVSRELTKRIPVNVVRAAPAPQPGAGGPQAAVADTTTLPADTTAPPLKDSPQPNVPKTGIFNLTVTNTQAIFTPTLGRRFFDIIWLPNRAEKYVVQAQPGLGNANIGITMTQGWGLYGLNANIDNSAITQPIADMYKATVGAMSDVVKGKITALGAVTGAPQGSFKVDDVPKGSRVTIKVTKVTVAAPGLYPVLSEEEMRTAPPIAKELKEQGIHLPTWPYSHVAFNTYEVIVIEAAKASGDSPMNLQRYYDPVTGSGSAGVPPSPYSPSVGKTDAASFDVVAFEKTINGLLANRPSPTKEYWQLSDLKLEDKKLKATAALIGGTNKPPELNTIEQLKNFVASQTGMAFQAKDIDLVERK